MTNVRAMVTNDLASTLEGEFGLPISLIGPDGQIYSKDKNGNPLKARIVWGTVRPNLQTGELTSIKDPIITIRRASLSRVPVSGETWCVMLPANTLSEVPSVVFYLDKGRAVEGDDSLGTVRLYLSKVAQS
jgi:hypothetical protein